MLKILGAIIGVILVAIAGFAIFASMKPDSFRVQRSLAIKAPPDRIIGLITDLKGWTAWSPYEAKDPGMKRTYSGAPSGKGAVYAWDGNNDVGAGRMEIIDVTPTRATIKLDFIRPFEGHNTAEFALAPQGDATTVTWSMHGPAPFITKVMGTIFDLDKMIGNDFEAGLARLKSVAEQ